MPVHESGKTSEVTPSGERSNDNRYVMCTGVPPGMHFVVGAFNDSTFSKLVDDPPKPRALFVVRTEYLERLFSRFPDMKKKFDCPSWGPKGLKEY
ncbi:MAG: hypothetical protein JXA73_04980 [Acidobacteria bacterium]|nr:hypothetical protein [Acidobacteriota bacterium]